MCWRFRRSLSLPDGPAARGRSLRDVCTGQGRMTCIGPSVGRRKQSLHQTDGVCGLTAGVELRGGGEDGGCGAGYGAAESYSDGHH
jgi:hypothetical protein